MSDDEKAAEDFLNISPLKMAAMQLHEMYTNLRESGFTRREALYLVSRMMTNGGDE